MNPRTAKDIQSDLKRLDEEADKYLLAQGWSSYMLGYVDPDGQHYLYSQTTALNRQARIEEAALKKEVGRTDV